MYVQVMTPTVYQQLLKNLAVAATLITGV